MSLESLEQTGDIGSLEPSAHEISMLLKKAARKLSDAEVESISIETRLEQA